MKKTEKFPPGINRLVENKRKKESYLKNYLVKA